MPAETSCLGHLQSLKVAAAAELRNPLLAVELERKRGVCLVSELDAGPLSAA